MDKAETPVALVTGSSRGAGRAIALRLAAQGAQIFVHYYKEKAAAEAVATAAAAAGGRVLGVVGADLREAEDVNRLMDTVAGTAGRLDVLVANAAGSVFKPLTEVEDRHFMLTFNMTVLSFLRMVHAAVPVMPPGGRIIAISGWDTLRYLPGNGLKAAAKAAVDAMVPYLAIELAPQGIRVNSVCPGSVDSDSFRAYAGEREEQVRAELTQRTPLGRIGRPEDVAAVVAFLACDAGEWITGQKIVTDGGISLT